MFKLMNDRYIINHTLKVTCLVILIIFVGFCPYVAQGQFISNNSGIVEVDSNTAMLNKSLPFDQQFTLRITYQQPDPPVSISIFKMDKFGHRLPTSKRDYMKHFGDDYPKPRPKTYKTNYYTRADYRAALQAYRLSRRSFEKQYDPNYAFYTIYPKDFVKIKSGKTSTTVTVNVPPLAPNRQYWFNLLRRDGPATIPILKIAQSLNANDRPKAEEIYSALIKDRYDVRESNQLPSLNSLAQSFKQSRLIILESDNSQQLLYTHELSIVPVSDTGVINRNSITLPSSVPSQAWPCCEALYDFSTLKDFRGNALFNGSGYKLYRKSTTFVASAAQLPKTSTSANYTFDGHSLVLAPGSTSSGIGITIRRSPSSLAKEISDIENTLSGLALPVINSSIVDLQKQLTNYKCDKSGNLNSVPFCENRNNLLQTIGNLVKRTQFDKIAQGLLAINYNEPVSLSSPGETQIRIAQIGSSLLLLEQLQQYANYLISNGATSSTGTFSQLVNDLDQCMIILNEGLIKLKNISATKSEFLATLSRENVNVNSSNSNNGTTDVFDFKTRSKFRIVPDFGLIAAFTNTPVDFRSGTTFAPYLGFHINFRPINKDIPFRLVRYKTVAHRLSFMAGLTLTSIKSENQREDLFGSRSLVTGLGFRMSNAVKIAVGGLWYKALDTNPLLDNKKTSVAPFIGVSFDLEIKELLGGIVDLFK